MTVLFIFVLLAYFGTLILHETVTFVSGATIRAESFQAYGLACSGLEWARLELEARKDLDGDGKVGQIGSPNGSVQRPFGGGTFWVQATRKGKSVVLISHGTFQGITKNIRSIEIADF